MPSNVSRSPAKVGFRCPTCGEYTVRPLEWSRDHDSLPCEACGGFIDLGSRENRALIARQTRRRPPLDRDR